MEVLIPITFFMSVAAVMILRPISKKLGGLIEASARDKAQPVVEDPTHTRTALVLEHMLKRLDAIEERLDFTERLVGDRTLLPNRADQRLEGRAAGRFPRRNLDTGFDAEHAAG